MNDNDDGESAYQGDNLTDAGAHKYKGEDHDGQVLASHPAMLLTVCSVQGVNFLVRRKCETKRLCFATPAPVTMVDCGEQRGKVRSQDSGMQKRSKIRAGGTMGMHRYYISQIEEIYVFIGWAGKRKKGKRPFTARAIEHGFAQYQDVLTPA